MAAVLLVVGCGAASSNETGGSSSAPSTETSAVRSADGTTTTVGSTTISAVDTTGSPESLSAPAWFGDHLGVGDCWNDQRDEEGEFDYSGIPDLVPCEQPHDNQVTGTWTSEADSYPGEDALYSEADDVCDQSFVEFVGVDYGGDALEGFAVVPTAGDWNEGGRQSVCSVYLPGDRLAGTLEGIRYGARPYDFPSDAPIPADARIVSGGDSEDGQRATGFELTMSSDRAVAEVMSAASEAGWETDPPVSGSRTVVMNMSDGTDDYTLTISALDEDQPDDLTLVFYYPPGSP
jgi:hypothetical protein